MAQITKSIEVDVAKKNLFQAIIAKQSDSNSRFLNVTLCNEGVKIEIPATASAIINAERADGASKAFAGTVNADGTVTVPLTNWMLALDDIVRCSISIIDSDEQKLSSTSFSLEVEAAECSDSGISEDENYDILIRLISDCSAAKTACETAAADARSAASEATRNNQTFANALRGSASGEVVVLEDVSPVTHDMDVTVAGKNLFDISKVESTTGLTNNGDGTLTATKYGTGKTLLKTICPGLKAGYAYTLILETEGANLIYLGEVKQNWYSGKSLTITEDMLNSTVLFYCKKDGTSLSGATISNIQIELGTTATEYTPYIDPSTVILKKYSTDETDYTSYTPNADGTVDGVTSLYPITTLTTEMGGVVINCAYNKDLNDAIPSAYRTIYIDSSGRGVNQSDGSTYSLTTIYSDAYSNLDRYRFVYVGGAAYKSAAPISAKSGYDNYADDAIILTAILDDDYAGLNYLKAYWHLSDARVTWTSKSIYNPDPCLIEGTPIDMADGTTKAVEDVRAGDIVQSCDPATGEMTPAVVIGAYLTGESRNYTVYSFTNGKYLTVYGMHGIYSKGKGTTKDIRKITRDDKIVSIDGSIVQWIASSDTFLAGEKKRRYNLVTSNNLYFANGILLGHKPFSKLQYALDANLQLSEDIRAVWQDDVDEYNSYSSFIGDPAYHAEIAEAHNNLSRANHIIAVNKQRLTNSDYLVQKFTEGLLSLGEWTAAKAKRATWRKEVNDNEVLRDESKATVDAIIAKYRGDKTPRSIFEACCARDNALFDTVKAYFAGGDGA